MTLPPSYRRNPLILVIGATGTGKSNLAVQIAQYLSRTPPQSRPASLHNKDNYEDVPGGGAEIINADAMQLYHGLPIITNKITVAEQRGIPHHLLGQIGLDEEPWTVQHFVKEADRAIGQIQGEGKIPIVVGGTGYYVHGLLFRDAVLEPTDDRDPKEALEAVGVVTGYGRGHSEGDKNPESGLSVLNASTQEIYARLMEVDPEMARRWHPNDRKKIQRSLEIYLQTGRRASAIYEEQRRNADGVYGTTRPGGADVDWDLLRYDPIIFWLEAEDKVLKERLDARVDSMVLDGLLDESREMDQLEQKLTAKNTTIDKSKGIWVSIGYKEMEPWLQAQASGASEQKQLATLKASCIEAVKASTRRYAKRQNRYIRIRLANALARAQSDRRLFLLDCTNLEKWHENVQTPAETLIQSFLLHRPLPPASELSELARNTFDSMSKEVNGEQRIARRCDVCDKVLMTEKEWIGHIKSRHHKRVLQSMRKNELKLDGPDAKESITEVGAG